MEISSPVLRSSYSIGALQMVTAGDLDAAHCGDREVCGAPQPCEAELRGENELSRVAILKGLAVNAALDSDIVRVDRVLRHNGRADRGVVVESLSEQPLATVLLELPVTRRNIVGDSV